MLSWKDISDLFVAIEQRLIVSLKRNLAGHKKWERDEGFDWPAWQAEKLKHIERFRQENKAIMGEYSDTIDFQARKLMAEQFTEGSDYVDRETDAAEAWSGRSPDAWNKRGDRVSQRAWNRPQKQPGSLSEDHFFGVNDRRLENLMKDMHEAEQTAQNAALRMMDDVYRRTISQAATAMATGATTLPQAIDMAVKDFLRAGINCIEYSNGTRVNIADYAQMALRTAATRSLLQGEAKRRAELGVDTVLVSQYGACSNTCLPWQGRVYIDDVWGEFEGETKNGRGLSADGNWYPLLSVAVKAGLFHPNCRHTVSTWFEGISKLPDPMDTADIKENSALEQQQRAMEKKIREYKRMAEGFQDPAQVKEYKRKTAAAQKELREFIAEHDDVLRRDYWREKTYGITGTKPAAEAARRNTGEKVEFDPSHDFSISLPEYSEQVQHGLSTASRIVAENGARDGTEHLIMVDLQTGLHDYKEGGSSASVGGGEFWNFIHSHPDQRFAFVHNHNTDGSFSETDMRTLLTTPNIEAFIAVRLDGIRYIAVKSSIPTDSMFDNLYSDELQVLNKLSREGIITAGERTKRREEIIVNNLLRDFTKGLIELD